MPSRVTTFASHAWVGDLLPGRVQLHAPRRVGHTVTLGFGVRERPPGQALAWGCDDPRPTP